MINAQLNSGISGHYKLIVSSVARGSRVAAEFDNIILDSGLARMHGSTGSAGVLGFVQVGTGTSTPVAAQTALDNRIAGTGTNTTNSSSVYVVGPPDYCEWSTTYRFATGVAAGNLTEVGIGWATSGSLFSRALILDGLGAPTTLTILSDEQLDVVYTIRVYPPTSDVTGSITISGTSYSYTIRPASLGTQAINNQAGWYIANLLNSGLGITQSDTLRGDLMSSYTGTLGARTSNPSGTVDNAGANGTQTPAAYVGGSYQRTVEHKFELGAGNLGGGGTQSVSISYMASFSAFRYQTQFSPNLLKDATKVLRLNYTYSFARRP